MSLLYLLLLIDILYKKLYLLFFDIVDILMFLYKYKYIDFLRLKKILILFEYLLFVGFLDLYWK